MLFCVSGTCFESDWDALIEILLLFLVASYVFLRKNGASTLSE